MGKEMRQMSLEGIQIEPGKNAELQSTNFPPHPKALNMSVLQ